MSKMVQNRQFLGTFLKVNFFEDFTLSEAQNQLYKRFSRLKKLF